MKNIKNYNIFNESSEKEYMLGYNSINGIEILDEIIDNQLFDYEIVDRENIIDNLIDYLCDAKGHDRILMKEDLKTLINIDDEYIFSSISTNDFIDKSSSNFNDICKELLEFNENYLKNQKTKKFNL